MGVGADLNVDATVSVLAQENGLLSFPAPAGQESTVDQQGGVLGTYSRVERYFC